MGLSHKNGDYVSCKNCLKSFYVSKCHLFKKGEIRQYCSLECKNVHYRGENHSGWKGGLALNEPAKYLKIWVRKQGKAYLQSRDAKRKALGNITREIVQKVYEENIKNFGTLTCYLCLKPIEFGQDCLEHKHPVSKGGTNDRNNLDIAHRGCNSRKKNMSIQEYKEKFHQG